MQSARVGKRGATLAQKLTFVRHAKANFQRRWLCRRKMPRSCGRRLKRELTTGDFHDFGQDFGRRLEGVGILSPSMYLGFGKEEANELPHRHFDASPLRELPGFFVAGVGVANDSHAGIGAQNALDSLRHHLGAIGDCDLACMK
jgi:hypothetical protein